MEVKHQARLKVEGEDTGKQQQQQQKTCTELDLNKGIKTKEGCVNN